MVRTAVESSCIRAVGYDAATCVLEIEFVSGAVYQYARVPGPMHGELMSASSHGSYFNRSIRDRFDYVRTR